MGSIRSIRAWLVMAGSLLCVACSQSNPFYNADRVEVGFYTPGTHELENVVSTDVKAAIKKMAQFVSGRSLDTKSCASDGKLVFYKDGLQLGEFSFNYQSDSCRRFSQKSGAGSQSTVLNNEAADFLKSLYQGKAWY